MAAFWRSVGHGRRVARHAVPAARADPRSAMPRRPRRPEPVHRPSAAASPSSAWARVPARSPRAGPPRCCSPPARCSRAPYGVSLAHRVPSIVLQRLDRHRQRCLGGHADGPGRAVHELPGRAP
jgi:hypothetical protein